MGRLAVLVVVLYASILTPNLAMGADEPLKCDIGPIQKTYGKTQWVVYSCADGRTVVIHSAPGNPAMPFYFMFFPREDGYRLYGEGTGRKEATAAAHEELKTFSDEDIAALITQTKSGQKQ